MREKKLREKIAKEIESEAKHRSLETKEILLEAATIIRNLNDTR